MILCASDYLHILDEFKTFADSNAPYDLVISSCREEESLYSYFFEKFHIKTDTDIVLEIPMAKITRRNQEYYKYSMKWYEDKCTALIL